MSMLRDIQEPGDYVFTMDQVKGGVRTWIVEADGTLSEVKGFQPEVNR